MAFAKSCRQVIITPTVKHSASVIFLHGRGDTGSGIMEWLKGVGFSPLAHVKYVFPTAPESPVTLAGGEVMPSWFDTYGFIPRAAENENDVKVAASFIDELIAKEEKLGILPRRIVIGGFSQGGAVSLYWSVTRPKLIGGIVALSTWLPCSSQFPGAFSGNSQNKVFIGHGVDDPRIRVNWSANDHNAVCKLLVGTCTLYEGLDHSLRSDEIRDVQNFISKCLSE